MEHNCTSVDIYDSLEHCPGKTVLPGLTPEAWYIPNKQILKFPKPSDIDSKDASLESIATLSEDFVLAADSVFHRMDILSMASKVTAASQGEFPSKTFLNSLTLKIADTGAKATGFCRMANADNLTYVVRQRDGVYRVIGNSMIETDTKPAQDSGMSVTDASGTTLEISVTDVCPAPIYKGKLKTADGVIDCSTGEITLPEEPAP